MKKNRIIIIRCTSDEYDTIKKKASKCGLAVSSYLRLLATNVDFKIISKEI